MTDVDLVRQYRAGDEYAFNTLMERHAGLIYSIAKQYFIQGAARSDTWQEGCIGFCKAVRDYDLQHHFPPFAALCVKRQVLSAVRLAAAKKHQFLIGYEWIENLAEEPVAPEVQPDEVDLTPIEAWLDLLTPMERSIMECRLDGYFHLSEISTSTGYSLKSIDNALCRSRKKLRKVLANHG